MKTYKISITFLFKNLGKCLHFIFNVVVKFQNKNKKCYKTANITLQTYLLQNTKTVSF